MQNLWTSIRPDADQIKESLSELDDIEVNLSLSISFHIRYVSLIHWYKMSNHPF